MSRALIRMQSITCDLMLANSCSEYACVAGSKVWCSPSSIRSKAWIRKVHMTASINHQSGSPSVIPAASRWCLRRRIILPTSTAMKVATMEKIYDAKISMCFEADYKPQVIPIEKRKLQMSCWFSGIRFTSARRKVFFWGIVIGCDMLIV